MPRPLRPIDDGLIYHVINRGNNRQNVFHKDADFMAFLMALADLKERKPFELYGKHHRSGGHVWQGRFKSPVIQHDDPLLTVLRYIEANPLRANIVARADDYRCSSYLAHGLGQAHTPWSIRS
jgi:putative transposase